MYRFQECEGLNSRLTKFTPSVRQYWTDDLLDRQIDRPSGRQTRRHPCIDRERDLKRKTDGRKVGRTDDGTEHILRKTCRN